MKLTLLSKPSVELSWDEHRAEWNGCTKCLIGHHAHNHVFARGTLPCEILFVGEAPGKTEDVTGWPFIGKSGRILETWIHDAAYKASVADFKTKSKPDKLSTLFKGQRDITYAITNIVLCRPCDRPGGPNRPPTAQEAHNCRPRFDQFVREIARPKAIVTVGRQADNHRTWTDIPTLSIVHPAYTLRLSQKSAARESEKVVDALSKFMLKELYGG